VPARETGVRHRNENERIRPHPVATTWAAAPAAAADESPSMGVLEAVVTAEQVRSFGLTLPRTTEGVVRGRLKLRVGRIVYVAFSRDETLMGFAFPKDWREALVESEPDKFMLPRQPDLRYN